MDFKYALTCQALRSRADNGEAIWHSLMGRATRISQAEFERNCDPSAWLDDGESMNDLVRAYEDVVFYVARFDDEVVFFAQHSGFEFFFTVDGRAPKSSDPSAAIAQREWLYSNSASRILLGPNDGRLAGQNGEERIAAPIRHDIRQIQGKVTRFVLYKDGEAVAGVAVDKEKVVQGIYVLRDLRGNGLAQDLAKEVSNHLDGVTFAAHLSEAELKFFRAFEGAKSGPHMGYRVVAFDPDTQQVSTLYGAESVDLKLGRILAPKGGLYLGTDEGFTEYYTGMSDLVDLILEVEYRPEDIIQGTLSPNSEIVVSKGVLRGAKFAEEDAQEQFGHLLQLVSPMATNEGYEP